MNESDTPGVVAEPIRTRRPSVWTWIAAACGLALLTGTGIFILQRRPPAGMPPIRWRMPVAGLQTTLGAIGPDGTLYTGTAEVVMAIDQSGQRLWTFTNGPALGSVRLGSNGDLYLSGYRQGTRRVICLGTNGTFRWDARAATMDGFAPVVSPNGTVATSGTDRELHAFSPDGKPLWSVDLASAGYGPPLVRPDGSFVVLGKTPGPGLMVVSPEGQLLGPFSTHRFTNEPSLRQARLAPDGTVYLAGSAADFLQAVAPGGPLRWRLSLDREATSGPVLDAGGRILLTARDPATQRYEIIAVSPDGKVAWRRDLGTPYADTTPVVTPDGSICFTTGEPALWCLDRDGQVRWKYRIPRPIQWQPPARMSFLAWSNFLRQLVRAPRAIAHTQALVAPDGSLRVGLGGPEGYFLQIDAPGR